jgi:hypothetical protein
VNGDQIITLIGNTSFTVAVFPVDPTFTNNDGAVTYRKLQSTGNGTYTGGGRVSLDSELPTYFNKVIGGSVTYSGMLYDLRGYQIDDLNKERSSFGYTYPLRATIYRRNGRKYLRIDPKPSVNGDVTIYGQLQITPKEYYHETSNLTIHLPSEYDPMILDFMKARAFEKLGDTKESKFWTAEFERRVQEHNMNHTSTLVEIVYK